MPLLVTWSHHVFCSPATWPVSPPVQPQRSHSAWAACGVVEFQYLKLPKSNPLKPLVLGRFPQQKATWLKRCGHLGNWEAVLPERIWTCWPSYWHFVNLTHKKSFTTEVATFFLKEKTLFILFKSSIRISGFAPPHPPKIPTKIIHYAYSTSFVTHVSPRGSKLVIGLWCRGANTLNGLQEDEAVGSRDQQGNKSFFGKVILLIIIVILIIFVHVVFSPNIENILPSWPKQLLNTGSFFIKEKQAWNKGGLNCFQI